MAANSQESLVAFFNDSLLAGEVDDEDIDKIKWVTAFNRLGLNTVGSWIRTAQM